MKPYTYLLINIACISIPFIASFYPKHPFFKTWKSFFFANVLVAVPFIIWDMIFTANGVWGFNPDYLTGVHIGNLPIEEVLFFICIPYACVFTYFAFIFLLKKDPLSSLNKLLFWLMCGICVAMIILGWGQIYTVTTGIFTLLFLNICKGLKVSFEYIFFTYICILPFFFASNGILTGSFIESPIVWYNNEENFGFRLWTIPIEDSIYGFLMVAANIVLYRFFTKKSKIS